MRFLVSNTGKALMPAGGDCFWALTVVQGGLKDAFYYFRPFVDVKYHF